MRNLLELNPLVRIAGAVRQQTLWMVLGVTEIEADDSAVASGVFVY